jgi:hypothetical protein
MVLKDRTILDIHLNILAMVETYKKYTRQNGQMIGKKMIWYYFYNF